MKQFGIIVIVLVFIFTTVTIQSKDNRKEIFEYAFIISAVITITVVLLIGIDIIWKKFKSNKISVTDNQNIPYPPICVINSGVSPSVVAENILPDYNQARYKPAVAHLITSENKVSPPKYEEATVVGPPPSYHG